MRTILKQSTTIIVCDAAAHPHMAEYTENFAIRRSKDHNNILLYS